MARLLAQAVLRPAFWPGPPATSAATRTPPVSREASETPTPTSTPESARAPHTTRPPRRPPHPSSHSSTHSRTVPALAPDHNEPALHRLNSTRQLTRLVALTRGETTQRVAAAERDLASEGGRASRPSVWPASAASWRRRLAAMSRPEASASTALTPGQRSD